MNIINMTVGFERWLAAVVDDRLRAAVLRRISQAACGNFGDSRPVGAGISEMRIHYGKGWRVYYVQEGRCVYLLLNAGDKHSQHRDIKTAHALWEHIQHDSKRENGK